MKKWLILLLTLAQMTIYAREAVYLKNGNIVKGNITELIPNQSVTIKSDDGSIFVFKSDEIEKIEHDTSEAYAAPKKKAPREILKKGFNSQIYGSLITGNMYGITISAAFGHQFDKHSFLGMCSGIRLADDRYDTHVAVPVFANFRYDIFDYGVTPFISARLGATIAVDEFYDASGFYGGLDLGCRFKRFMLSTGIETVCGEDDSSSNYGLDEEFTYQAVNFVLRFGVVF